MKKYALAIKQVLTSAGQGEESEEIPLSELIAAIEEKAANITEAIAQLKKIMGDE